MFNSIIPKRKRQTIPIDDSSKHNLFTNENTGNKGHSVSVKGGLNRSSNRENLDTYFQLRMNKEWKKKVKMLSEMNDVSFSNFIRQSVDKNIQSLSR